MKSMSAADLSQPKLPPQNLEAEQSVLGAVLLDNSAMAKAMELLVEENFYRTSEMSVLRYETGASNVTLSGLANANFSTLIFSGGAGDYELDFSGKLATDGTARIEAGSRRRATGHP